MPGGASRLRGHAPTPARSRGSRLLRHRPGQRLPPPPRSASRRSPAPRERNVVQIADPALPPKSRPSDRRQIRRNLEAGYELDARPRRRDERRSSAPASSTSTSRRCAAPAPPSTTSSAPPTSTASSRPSAPGSPSPPPPSGELAAASIAAVSDGFLHYYLSGSADSHLRDSPMKNVVAAWSSTPPSWRCRSTSAAASRPATRSRSSSAASPTASSPGAPRRSSATAPPTSASRRPRRRRLLPRLPRVLETSASACGSAGVGPVKGKRSRRLAAVLAPGLLAEGADRVERDRALVFGQPSRLVQVVAATS